MGKEFVKRKTYVIDKQFQFKFIATFILFVIIAAIIYSGGVLLFYVLRYTAGDNIFDEFITVHQRVEKVDENGNKYSTSVSKPPINRIQLLFSPILINLLILTIIISILGIFYSHRIAGPVYRIDSDISRVLKGEKGIQVRLRKKDKLHNLAEKINKLIKAYDK